MMRNLLIAAIACALATGCKRESKPASSGADFGSGPLPGVPADREKLVKLPSGLQYIDIQEGIGDSPTDGQVVAIKYRGYLPDGTEFDSSAKTGRAVRFALDANEQVMPAWIEGVRTMKPGGKRKLLIPPALGFGEGGRPPIVPRMTSIVMDIDLLRVFTPKKIPLRLPAGQAGPVGGARKLREGAKRPRSQPAKATQPASGA